MNKRKKSKPQKLKVTYKLAEGISKEEQNWRLDTALRMLNSSLFKNMTKINRSED